MKAFTENEIISQLIEGISKERLDKKVFSDVVDSSGNQYVDLVQEGGGVLGVALLGYTFLMERAGIRFFSLAGTSAGAINSMMMAALARVGEPVSEKTLKMLVDKDLSEIIDGDKRLWSLLQRFMNGRSMRYLSVVWNIRRLRNSMMRNLGMNPGDDFFKWIDSCLRENNISCLDDLHEHRKSLPGLINRQTGAPIERIAELKIIASDVTSKSKVTFPEMAGLYWHNPDSVSPACFVRASMSIPFFFEPYKVDNIPYASTYEDRELPREQTKWRKHTGYRGKIPSVVHFVDGGMLSNFPINAFHRQGQPAKPTFGARLSTWRIEAAEIKGLSGFSSAMISTMRQLHDYDFLLRHHDYKHLICSIDCDAQTDEQGNRLYSVLDFDLCEEKKVALFNHGALKAFEFLRSFDWENYKLIRSNNP